jgi:hypothetical protein
MADITLSTGRLISETGGAYTRQHVIYLSRLSKIPGAAQKKNGRWIYPDCPELRKWIKKARQKRQGVAKMRTAKARANPQLKFLKASDVAKRTGIGKRQVERLALTKLNEWHYLSPGGHHRFIDCPAIKNWCKSIKQKRQRKRIGTDRRDETNLSLISAACRATQRMIDWYAKHAPPELTWDIREQLKKDLDPFIDKMDPVVKIYEGLV